MAAEAQKAAESKSLVTTYVEVTKRFQEELQVDSVG